ncbi:DUF2807 domain-containing protein [Flavobacterium sp. 7A]|uniref:DUF2807 domain-containing protein n=1 Tax=Flavobacterium sp. 7A TaxID=2940571 RepID=UPI00222776D6|nr:DUF2807 domain-containing protein [Flavobacterium sp. 7A]MCW2119104.1 hypothetical protein [Flavobacterium sp. 7A]
MKKTLLTLFLLTFVASLQAQKKVKIKGDKIVVEKTYDLGGFDTVEVHDDLKITFTAGNSSSNYFLKADSNLHDVIKFEVVDSVLRIGTSAKITSSKRIEIILNVAKIHAIKLYDDAVLKQLGSLVVAEDFDIMGKDDSKMKLNINAKNINFSLSNSADGELNLQGESVKMILNDKVDAELILKTASLDLQLYKSAELTVSGDAENLRLSLVGKPVLKAEKLMTRTADVKQQDGSQATLNCSKEIAIFLEGNSKLYLYNSPKVIMNGFHGKSELLKR